MPSLPFILIWFHFLADFCTQTDKMATNKSSSNFWLGLHALCYTLIFFYFGWRFAIVTGAAHFVTDWITSRGTSYLWKTKQVRRFFALVGLDQAIHLTTLAYTYRWLVKH